MRDFYDDEIRPIVGDLSKALKGKSMFDFGEIIGMPATIEDSYILIDRSVCCGSPIDENGICLACLNTVQVERQAQQNLFDDVIEPDGGVE